MYAAENSILKKYYKNSFAGKWNAAYWCEPRVSIQISEKDIWYNIKSFVRSDSVCKP